MNTVLVVVVILFATCAKGCLDSTFIVFDENVPYVQSSQFLTVLPTNYTCGFFKFANVGSNDYSVAFKIRGPPSYGPLYHTIPRICFYNKSGGTQDIDDEPPDTIVACKNDTEFEIIASADYIQMASVEYITWNHKDHKPLWTSSVTILSKPSSPPHSTFVCNTHSLLLAFLLIVIFLLLCATITLSIMYYRSYKRLQLI